MNHHGAPVVVAIRDKQRSAMRFALDAARRSGRRLRVVHAVGASHEPPRPFVGDDFVRELRREGREVLDRARDVVEEDASDLKVDYVLAPGSVVGALEDEAAGACLIVVGTDDLTWPDRLFGGAVAAHLALQAPCPVVVVPERDHPWPLSGGVVVALDGEAPAAGPLRFAYEQASSSGRHLQVMHALPPGTEREDAEALRVDVAEILAGWGSQFPDVDLVLRFPIQRPDAACVEATERAELVVVGRPHRGVRHLSRSRSLAAHVIDAAHCPVAVVPADYGGL